MAAVRPLEGKEQFLTSFPEEDLDSDLHEERDKDNLSEAASETELERPESET